MIAWLLGKKKPTAVSSRKDDFVSLSSHELRSPLSIIKWYTEILLDGDAGPLTEEQRKYLTVIESSNQRAIDLVRSLLNVSRLDLGTFSISPEKCSVSLLVGEAVLSLDKNAKNKNVAIIRKEDLDIPEIMLDKHIVLFVLKHLLSNAVAFSQEGKEVMIETSLLQRKSVVTGETIDDESVLIAITDQGIGIPVDDQKKIFSKMFRASNVKDSDGTGSGLGLYLTKAIVDIFGGKLWFTSSPGKGSTFYVTLPTKGMKKKEGKTTLD